MPEFALSIRLKVGLQYIAAVLLIIVSGSLYYTSFNDDLILLGALFTVFALWAINPQRRIRKIFIAYFLINGLFVSSSILYHGAGASTNTYLGILIKIVISVLVLSAISRNDLVQLYTRVMVVLCVFNLVIYFDVNYLLNFSGSLYSSLPDLQTYREGHYYQNYLVYAKPIYGYVNNLRNPGIFGEGGVFQYFINLAILFNVSHFNKKFSSRSNIVLIVTLVTTFSTAGYISFMFILFLYASNRQIRLRGKLLYATIIITILSTEVVYNKIIDQEAYQTNHSTVRRMKDATADLRAFENHPIFGVGLGNYSTWLKYSNEVYGGSDSSNGITNYLAMVGITGFIAALWVLAWVHYKTKFNKSLLAIILISLFSQNTLMMSPIIITSIFLLIDENPNYRNLREENRWQRVVFHI